MKTINNRVAEQEREVCFAVSTELHKLTSDLREAIEVKQEEYENDPLAVASGMQDAKVNAMYDILTLLDTLEK